MKAAILRAVLSLGLVVCAALISCSRTRTAQRAVPQETNSQEFPGPTVDVPEFAIAVKLSPSAEKQLRSIHESVLVIAYFDGDALPGQGKHNPPMRDVFLGQDEKLLDEKSVARFQRTRVALADWNRLSDKNYFVTINTVSARNAATDNLLDCADPISRRIETFAGKIIEVQCRLIGELNAPTK
jgi:hypothetical protein